MCGGLRGRTAYPIHIPNPGGPAGCIDLCVELPAVTYTFFVHQTRAPTHPIAIPLIASRSPHLPPSSCHKSLANPFFLLFHPFPRPLPPYLPVTNNHDYHIATSAAEGTISQQYEALLNYGATACLKAQYKVKLS